MPVHLRRTVDDPRRLPHVTGPCASALLALLAACGAAHGVPSSSDGGADVTSTDAMTSDDGTARTDGQNESGGDAAGPPDGASTSDGATDGGAEGSLEASSDAGADGTLGSSSDASGDALPEGSSTSTDGSVVSSYDGGGVLLFGGFAASGAGFFDTWRFDGAAWSLIADTGPSDRWETGLAPLGSLVVLFGGVQEEPSGNGVLVLGDTWLFGPT